MIIFAIMTAFCRHPIVMALFVTSYIVVPMFTGYWFMRLLVAVLLS